MSSNDKYLREFGGFGIDLEKKVLWHSDEPVQLPVKAVELLCALVENRGEIITKDELLEKVWPDSFVEESVLSQNSHHLRKTFKDLNLHENLIQTIPQTKADKLRIFNSQISKFTLCATKKRFKWSKTCYFFDQADCLKDTHTGFTVTKRKLGKIDF